MILLKEFSLLYYKVIKSYNNDLMKKTQLQITLKHILYLNNLI